MDGDLLPHRIRSTLSTENLAHRIYYLPEVDSTNRVATELATAGEPDGTLVIADVQTAGRGRHGRSWYSPSGENLLFSVLLRPEMAARAVLPITLALCVAITDALSSTVNQTLFVRWPNDIGSRHGKIAGILSESSSSATRVRFVVVGVGLNVNVTQDELAKQVDQKASSLYALSGAKYDRRDVLTKMLSAMEVAYGVFCGEGFAPFVKRYNDRLTARGAHVRVTDEKSPVTVVGVESDGGLRVALTDGTERVLYDQDRVEF